MIHYSVEWRGAKELKTDDHLYHCRQVYAWLVTLDERVIIVSKDGKQWQFPGGKPNAGETRQQTAVREVLEETGIDISLCQDDFHFFGYYIVQELGSDEPPFTQLRYIIKLQYASDDLQLNVGSEDLLQDQQDVIQFVRAVTLDEALALIPWLKESPEFATVSHLL